MNSQATSKKEGTPAEKPETIRTMRSDVSQFLKETKPSLIQLLTTQAEAERPAFEEEPRRGRKSKILTALFIAGAALAAGAIGVFVWRGWNTVNVDVAKPVIPQAFFRVEKTAEISVKGFGSILQQLKSQAAAREKTPTLKRIAVMGAAGGHVSAKEFFDEAEIVMPDTSLESATGVMPVIYYGETGARAAVIIKANDAKRIFDQVFRREAEIADNWRNLLLDLEAPFAKRPFEDAAYRNIGFRALKLDEENDIGFVYGIYSAKRHFIMAASETAFKTVIDRLYEAN